MSTDFQFKSMLISFWNFSAIIPAGILKDYGSEPEFFSNADKKRMEKLQKSLYPCPGGTFGKYEWRFFAILLYRTDSQGPSYIPFREQGRSCFPL